MERQIEQMDCSSSERTVAFLTLGCKVNSYETKAMEQMFQKAGYEITAFDERAAIYIVNTCTVTNIADRKSRQMLHKAKKRNPAGIVVAVGCYVQAAKDTLDADSAIDLVVGNNQKKDIVSIVESYLMEDSPNAVYESMERVDEYEELAIDSAGEKTRANIKVQDGCNQFCSYCIIPYTRGRVRSRKQDQVVQEVKRLAEKGYQEVVLTGIHLSSYGFDFDKAGYNVEEPPLLSLIQAVSQVEGIKRIRLGSLEPRIISERFVKELSANDKFCPHFHLSLQSGCDDTLKRMNRRYTTEEFLSKCELLRKYFINPAITTDIIVGFPGETEEEFEQTAEFVRKADFSQMHVFKYSKRKGTKAADMEYQIDESVKNERSSQLLSINKELMKAYKERFIGSQEVLLVEEEIEIDGIRYQTGHNERYLKLAAVHENTLTNQMLSVHVTGLLNNDILLCEII